MHVQACTMESMTRNIKKMNETKMQLLISYIGPLSYAYSKDLWVGKK